MTRWLIAGLVLGIAFVGAMLYVARPEVIEKQVKEIAAPITRAIAEHDAKKWAAAKDQAYGNWMSQFQISPDCVNPRSALKETECKNKMDTHAQAFERHWQQRIASGWEPN